MLLALLDLARSGGLSENHIRFLPPLLDRYRQYFDAVRAPGDHPNSWFPFFHLAGELRDGQPSFWHLKPLPGRQMTLAALDSARSSRAITENVDYAYLDDELFALLQDQANVDGLSAALAEQWFARDLVDLKTVAEQGKAISSYEHHLRDLDLTGKEVREAPAAVRDPAFRRLVTEIYDYRCAATGVRFLLPGGTALVEAAHIHPFFESRDDDPRNGIALTPDTHWAMDQNLIAPGSDYLWHVSKTLDERIPDHQFLVRLKGKPLILPSEKRWYPRQDVLQWKIEQLL